MPKRTRSRRPVIAAAAVATLFASGAGVVAASTAFAEGGGADPAAARQTREVPTSTTSKLQNTAKGTFLGLKLSPNLEGVDVWVDTADPGSDVTYPLPGNTGVVSFAGTCWPKTMPEDATNIAPIPVGDGGDCLTYSAVSLPDGSFTFQIDTPGAPTNGRYLGDGNNGGYLDALSTDPLMTFKVPEFPSATLSAKAELVDADHDGRASAGDTIAASAVVVNTGNAVLSTLAVTDTLGSTFTCPSPTLAPDATVTCTATPHDLMQADVDGGIVTDAVSFTSQTPDGTPVTAGPASVDTTLAAAPSASSKVASDAGDDLRVGDTVTYTSTVTNTGNVTLSGLALTGTLGGGVTLDTTVLAPGEVATGTSSTVVTQAQVDAGSIADTVTGSAAAPLGAAVNVPKATTTDAITQVAAGTTSVTSDAGDKPKVGDTVTYTTVVENTGNVTLENLALSETLGENTTLDTTILAPGARATATSTHIVTQSDLDAGHFDNGVSPVATAPNGATVTLPKATVTNATSAEAAGTVSVVSDAGASGGTVGSDVAYTTTITNTGTATLTDLASTETLGEGTACLADVLEPGASTTCTSTHTVTQKDVDRGTLTNQVTVTGRDSAGHDVTLPVATVTDTLAIASAGTVDLRSDAPDQSREGTTVHYTATVTNTGDVTLTDVTATGTLTDDLAGDTTELAPGETATFTGSYEVTAADASAKSFENTVTATGTTPQGDPIAIGSASVTSAAFAPTVVELAFTGAQGLQNLAVAAILLLLAGTALVVARRRTREARPASVER